MTTPMDYETACARATTEQGLDPVISALRAAGLDAKSEQTGGFTMVATVYNERGDYVGITFDGDVTNGERLYMYGFTPAGEEDDGSGDYYYATLTDLPRQVRSLLASCPRCE